MGIHPEDLRWGKDFGYALKLLARGAAVWTARRTRSRRGSPGLHPAGSLLAGVRGAFNAVVLNSEALGPSMLFGQGAGAMPTGSAVVSDIIDLSRNVVSGSPGRVPLPPPGRW